MRKIAIIGHYGAGKLYLDGQTIKTKIVTNELVKYYGENEVTAVDTHGGAKRLILILLSAVKVLATHKNVVILPADKGLKTLAPWFTLWNVVFRRKIHYCVIGGWLPELLKDRPWLVKCLNNFSGTYVETSTMEQQLKNLGLEDVVILPNCKDLPILSEDDLVYPTGEPYSLCTFSRVTKKKGIEDAIDAVCNVNRCLGRTAYVLDIYGQVNPKEQEWFEQLQSCFLPEIRYKGTVPFDQSVGVLKDYYALLFPTRFYTEGVPGTIIDAYAAGVPVISARWESFADVIIDGQTGIGYSFNEKAELEKVLVNFANDPDVLLKLKKNCLKQAVYHSPEVIEKVLFERLA